MKYLQLPVLLLTIILFISCGDKGPNRAKVVSKLKGSAKLATVEYIVTKVISAENKVLLGKNTYFFAETEAHIKAGIDLDKLTEDDIKIVGTKITIKLPAIEIINFSYPADAFKVVDSYTYSAPLFWWRNFDIEKRDELYRQGETDIRDNIKYLGIVESARKNTIMFLKPVLESSGFEEIYISFHETDDKNLNQSDLVDQSEELKKQK